MKKCTKCGIEKEFKEFGKNKYTKDGLVYECRVCKSKRALTYSKTFKGFLTDVYGAQRTCSRKRKHPMPVYSKQDLGIWINAQTNFSEIWENWVKSDYDVNLKPSVDRLDDYKGYSFENIQLMTWGGNNNKARLDEKEGRLTKRSKAVIQINKTTGEVITEFHSIRHAARETNISRNGISKCCLKEPKYNTAGGFKWCYKEDTK